GYFSITVTDNDPPASHSGSSDIISTTGELFTIYANFTDNIGIETAEIYYKSEPASEWETLEMARIVSEDQIARFFITNIGLSINTTNNDTDYLYYVLAKDQNLLECQYCPKTSKPVWNITITDNDPPTALSGGDQAVEDGTDVIFDASTSTDNIGITDFDWEFNYETEEKVLSGESTSFVFVTPGNYFVNLIVSDAAGNEDTDTFWVNVTYIDRIAPTIRSVHPLDKSENVQIDTEVVVKFSEPMDIDASNIIFFEMKDSSDQDVQGNFTYTENFDQDLYVLTFTPTITLDYEETYYCSISTDPADTTGNHLEQGRSWQFTTIAEDSDEDGLPDWWEEQYFGESKINEVGPSGDPDGDSFTNLEEYTENTDPTRSDSHPPIRAPSDDDEEDNTYAVMAGIVGVFVIVVILFLFLILRKSKEWKSEVGEELKEEEPSEEKAEGPAEGEPESEEAVPPEVEGEAEEEPPQEEAAESEVEEKELEGDESALEEETGGEGDEVVEEPDQDLAAAEDEFEGELEVADKELEEGVEGGADEEPAAIGPDVAQAQIQGHATKAAELYQQGEYAEAIIEWQKIIELEPDHPEIMDSIQDAMAKLKEG
ncbi:MAG: Ig-like domain-containing protein, partial [Thermoplasmata archaeon]|nr:Ig-like domain-containing protein [Thermoplasmata archaeon]